MAKPILFLLSISLLFLGCSSVSRDFSKETRETKSNIFWPAPPAEPRIFFVKNISSYKDFGIPRSFLGRIKDFLVGQQEYYFSRPMAAAVDGDGSLYFTDADLGVVYAYHPQKKKVERITQVDKKIDFVSPVGISVSSDGIIYVADSYLKKVFAINEKGVSRFILGEPEGIVRPTGVFAVNKKIYVADTEGCQVLVFDDAGKFLLKFGQRGDGEGEFNFPTHIFVDASERIYVSDTINSRVQIFDPQGGFLKSIGSAGDSSGHFSRPKGVAVDSLGHIYVADALFDNIQIFDYDKNFLLSFGEAGQGEGEFWLPAGITVGKDNTLYVADSYNKRISVFEYIGKE